MKRSSSFVKVTLLAMIATILVFLIFKKDTLPYSASEKQTRQQLLHSPRNTSKDPWLGPQCEQNISAALDSGFSALPERIKDFLYYRHCRHFPLLLDVPDLCGATPQESADVFLLLVIKSTPWNYDRREVLRQTWAEERVQNGVWIRRVFISGTAGSGHEKHRLNRLLRFENSRHHDILQWDFHDTFINLTLKQVLFLEWRQRRCPQARFLLNGDDDIFANTDNMVQYLQNLQHNDGSKHLFAGHVNLYMPPIRESESKYFVPVQLQESDSYPPYCSGGGFLLSGFTAEVIYNMSHVVPLVPIDDVYMGMCLEKAALAPMSHFGVWPLGLNIPSEKLNTFDPCYYREIILVHRFQPHEIYSMWHEIHDRKLKCSV